VFRDRASLEAELKMEQSVREPPGAEAAPKR
jgi:hypothetical protein